MDEMMQYYRYIAEMLFFLKFALDDTVVRPAGTSISLRRCNSSVTYIAQLEQHACTKRT
jgi:hypothetical protein